MENSRLMNEPKKGLTPASVLVVSAVVIGFVGVVWWTLKLSREGVSVETSEVGPAGRQAGYVGDRACTACHPGESALHRQSGHSMTLRPAGETDEARRLDGREVKDPEYPGVSWRYAKEGRRLSVSRRNAGGTENFLIDYALGSGHHAVTFVSVSDRDPRHPAGMEHRLSCYTGEKTVDLTPGHEAAAPAKGVTPRGRPLPSSKLLRCFRCHTTMTSAQGRELLDVATMVPNVSCERCHGPARDHVDSARRGRPRAGFSSGAALRSADRIMRACGVCHRHPEDTPADAIRTENIEIVRHQPVGLMQSKCFQNSQGTLSCVTCHDPHAPASRDAAEYVAVCLSCHSSAPQTTCPDSPRDGCLDCHMPRRNSGQGISFADHWIRVVKGGVGPRPERPSVP